METSMQTCAACGSALKIGAIFCPVCGAQTKIKPKREKKYWPRLRPMQKVGQVINLIFILMIDFYCFIGWQVNGYLSALIISCFLLVVLIVYTIILVKRW